MKGCSSPAAAAAGITLGKEERSWLLADPVRGGTSAWVPQEGNPPSWAAQAEASLTGSLCCCGLLGAPAA